MHPRLSSNLTGRTGNGYNGSKRKDNTNDEKNLQNTFRRVLFVLLSHFSIMMIVILYVVAGAFLFRFLEQTNEINVCNQSQSKFFKYLADTRNRLWIAHKSDLTESQMMTSYTDILTRFAQVGFVLIYDPSQNCSTLGNVENNFRWSLANSILFCVTVITTVGYGYIAPRTMWGRIVCLVYATIGIPLMLLWLANVGDIMANVFRFLYWRVCCCGWVSKNRNTLEAPSNAVQMNHNGSLVESLDDTKKTITAPEKERIFVKSDEDESDDLDDLDHPVNVPIVVSIAILTVYITFGSILFGIWENWGAIESAYFSFITLSTIGFGDFVPGKDGLELYSSQLNMICAAVYMIFGMSILSMCVNLVQDEISAKFRWFGEKIGLLQETCSENEEEDDSVTPTVANDCTSCVTKATEV